MEKKPYTYTVVKYVPDPIKYEPRNIGIILQCKEYGYIDCIFINKMRSKLGKSISTTDIKVIQAYIDEYSQFFNPFSKFPTTMDLLQNQTDCLQGDYLSNLAKKGFGKIQFDEPRGGLTSNPKKELIYLFNVFVGEEAIQVRESIRHSRLKTNIKAEFKHNKWLTTAGQNEPQKHGFEVDAIIKGGRSHVEHIVDFAAQNGRLYLVEAVDLRKKEKEADTYKTALKYDDLYHGLKNDIVPYSIVALPEDEDTDYYLKILKAYSTVFIYSDTKEKREFLAKMSGIVEPNMFSDN